MQVSSDVAWIKGASLGFEQEVWRGDTLISSAKVTIVCVDRQTMRPVPIPRDVAEKMVSVRRETDE